VAVGQAGAAAAPATPAAAAADAGGPSALAAAASAPAQIQTPKYELPRTGSVVADKVAAGVLATGLALASGIGRAASAADVGIASYAEKQRATAQPNAKPVKVRMLGSIVCMG